MRFIVTSVYRASLGHKVHQVYDVECGQIVSTHYNLPDARAEAEELNND